MNTRRPNERQNRGRIATDQAAPAPPPPPPTSDYLLNDGGADILTDDASNRLVNG